MLTRLLRVAGDVDRLTRQGSASASGSGLFVDDGVLFVSCPKQLRSFERVVLGSS